MTEETMCPELLPCPFCGSEPKTVDKTEHIQWWIECSNCGAAGPENGNNDTQAAKKAWNRRVLPATPGERTAATQTPKPADHGRGDGGSEHESGLREAATTSASAAATPSEPVALPVPQQAQEPAAWSCVNEVAALGKCAKWCGDSKKCIAYFSKE